MILLDTHIWIWWLSEAAELTELQRQAIAGQRADEICVSAISCWEIAKLVELNRLELDRPVLEWLRLALAYPGVRLLEITPEIAVASTQLPGMFHRDPADQLIVATARIHGLQLVTSDRKIIDYEHVETVG